MKTIIIFASRGGRNRRTAKFELIDTNDALVALYRTTNTASNIIDPETQ